MSERCNGRFDSAPSGSYPVSSEGVMQHIEAVLCFLVRGERICLARKKKGIGVGCWNGYGGKVEPGQTRGEAVAEEVLQESGVRVDPASIVWRGVVDCRNRAQDGVEVVFRMYVCTVSSWAGEPGESEEMGPPVWFHRDTLPWGEMMPADRFWLPPIIEGRTIRARAIYGPEQRSLLWPVQVSEL